MMSDPYYVMGVDWSYLDDRPVAVIAEIGDDGILRIISCNTLSDEQVTRIRQVAPQGAAVYDPQRKRVMIERFAEHLKSGKLRIPDR